MMSTHHLQNRLLQNRLLPTEAEWSEFCLHLGAVRRRLSDARVKAGSYGGIKTAAPTLGKKKKDENRNKPYIDHFSTASNLCKHVSNRVSERGRR